MECNDILCGIIYLNMKKYRYVIFLVVISGITGGISEFYNAHVYLALKTISMVSFVYATKFGIKAYLSKKP